MITNVTDPLHPIAIASNKTSDIARKDNGESGNADLMGLSLWSGSSKSLFSGNWDGVKIIPRTLSGGTLKIH